LAYLSCVQCGHILTEDEERALHLRPVRHGVLRCLVGGAALPLPPDPEPVVAQGR
jgi:hypothetical protein